MKNILMASNLKFLAFAFRIEIEWDISHFGFVFHNIWLFRQCRQSAILFLIKKKRRRNPGSIELTGATITVLSGKLKRIHWTFEKWCETHITVRSHVSRYRCRTIVFRFCVTIFFPRSFYRRIFASLFFSQLIFGWIARIATDSDIK